MNTSNYHSVTKTHKVMKEMTNSGKNTRVHRLCNACEVCSVFALKDPCINHPLIRGIEKEGRVKSVVRGIARRYGTTPNHDDSFKTGQRDRSRPEDTDVASSQMVLQ
jgi:hypothetical protein